MTTIASTPYRWPFDADLRPKPGASQRSSLEI